MTSFTANQAAPSFRWGVAPTLDAVIPGGVRSLYFNAGGNIALVDDKGTSRIFAVTANQTLPVGPVKILTAGTTVSVSDIVPLY